MRKPKFIIMFTIHPVNRDYLKRYGYEVFRENDIEIIFFNVCNLLHGPQKTKLAGYDVLGGCPEVTEISINGYLELYFYLKNYGSRAIIYLNITASVRLLSVLCILRLRYIDGSLWGGIQSNHWTSKHGTLIERIFTKIDNLKREVLKKTLRKLRYFSTRVLRYIHSPHLTLTSNEGDLQKNPGINILLNHTFDYDRFLLNKEMPKPSYIPEGKYYLLLPNHAWMVHDYIINHGAMDCSMTKGRYSQLINNTLDKIETLIGIQIVVAGYPNGTIAEDVYINREFLLGTETEQLVKYSAGVLTHFSGAINFAVLHQKPICLINYVDFDDDPRFSEPIKAYARELNVPINYVDTDSKIEQLVFNGVGSMDDERYASYLNKFICPKALVGGPDVLFWERVLKNINGN